MRYNAGRRYKEMLRRLTQLREASWSQELKAFLKRSPKNHSWLSCGSQSKFTISKYCVHWKLQVSQMHRGNERLTSLVGHQKLTDRVPYPYLQLSFFLLSWCRGRCSSDDVAINLCLSLFWSKGQAKQGHFNRRQLTAGSIHICLMGPFALNLTKNFNPQSLVLFWNTTMMAISLINMT